MPDIRTARPGDKPLFGAVELGHHAPGLAVVSMRGEHDLSTAPELTYALEQAAAHSNVVVDLSECSFIDSTVIKALIKTALDVQARSEQLVLVIPSEQRAVARIAQMTHLAELVPIHTTRSDALATIQPSSSRGPEHHSTGVA
jgi:anti-sigma B factor antagonist